MIEIYLDSTQVYPKQGQTIKMTKENPALTEKGTYSLDIEFPLDIPANRLFFGPLCRSEVSKDHDEYDAEIKDGAKVIIEGLATIVKVTDQNVSIQITSASSTKGVKSIMDKVYIDQMSLGVLDVMAAGDNWKVYYTGGNRLHPFVPLPDWEIEVDYTQGNNVRLPYSDPNTYYARLPIEGWRCIGDPEKVIFIPVWDETHSVAKNETTLVQTKSERDQGVEEWGVAQRPDTPQPNLMFIIKAIFELIGYSVNLGQYGQEPFTRMYIANAHSTQALSYTLPHWTINEFIEQIKLFLGCSVEINEVRKTVALKSTASASSGTKTLDIIDDFETEIEKEEDAETKFKTATNMSYNLSDSAAHIYDKLPDEVLKNFEIKDFESYQEMKSEYDAASDSLKSRYIYRCPDGYYCKGYADISAGRWDGGQLYEWTMLKVHMFGDYISNENSDEKTELKICPVAIDIHDSKLHSRYKTNWSRTYHYTMEITLKDERKTGNKNVSVWEGITDGTEGMDDTPPEDRLQVFFFAGSTYCGKMNDCELWYPNPWTDYDYMRVYEDHQAVDQRPSWSLSMDEHNSAEFSMSHLHISQSKIKSPAAHTFRFLSSTPPDVSQVFLIKGKKYLCEKVEYDITDDGMDTLMTGYFYEIIE